MNVATVKTATGNRDKGGQVSLLDQVSGVDGASESIRDKVGCPMMEDLDDGIMHDFLIA
jgi:hypothetical protein